MTDESGFEQGMRALMEETRLERDRLQRAVEECDEKLRIYTTTLSDWRLKFGARKTAAVPVEPDLIETLRPLSVREMLLKWAEAHGGRIIMRDMTHAVTEAKLFRNREQAAGSLYATIGRMNEFQRLDRGVYQHVPDGWEQIAKVVRKFGETVRPSREPIVEQEAPRSQEQSSLPNSQVS